MFTGQNHKDGLLHWLSDKQVEEGQLISSNPNTTIYKSSKQKIFGLLTAVS